MVSTALVWGHHLPPNTGIESRIQIMSRHYFTMILKCMRCMLLCCCLVAQHVWLFGDPMDCGPPGSSVHGILQARRVEWVAFPPPGNLPDPGIEPTSPVLQVDSLPLESLGKTILYRVLIQFERAKKTTTTTLASIQELRRPSFLSPFLSHSLIYTIFLIISIALDFIHSLWFIASNKNTEA